MTLMQKMDSLYKRHMTMDIAIEKIIGGTDYDDLEGQDKMRVYRIVKAKSKMSRKYEA